MERNVASPAALDGKSFAIGILSVTACILFVGFVIIGMLPSPALAIGQSDRAGDYIICTQQISNSNESIVIIDAAAKRMSMYSLDVNNRVIRPLHLNIPLDRAPGAALDPPPGP